jgi:hypothetical protein
LRTSWDSWIAASIHPITCERHAFRRDYSRKNAAGFSDPSFKSREVNSAAMLTFDITPDGKQIVFDRLRENSDIVLIDLPK